MLVIRNLSLKRNSHKILDNVSINVDSRVFSIIGKNGSGKTTLAYCIMGVVRDYDGEILFDDVDITRMRIHERAKLGITLAWQIPAEFEGLTVKDYLIASCKCSKLKKDEVLSEIIKHLKMVGLSPDYLDKRISELSGGERKRVELVSVGIMRPKLVILDEPDSGIDMLSFSKIRSYIKHLSKESIVLLITHSEIIAKLSTNSALLDKGKVILQGKTEEVLRVYNNHGVSDGK